MASLILPDSSYYLTASRAGLDPFLELGRRADDFEFATCGMVQIEVLRGRRDQSVVRRFRETFAMMIFINTTQAVWERAGRLAWALDRQGIVLPAPDLVVAATALQAGAAVLTYDHHFKSVPGLEVVGSLA